MYHKTIQVVTLFISCTYVFVCCTHKEHCHYLNVDICRATDFKHANKENEKFRKASFDTLNKSAEFFTTVYDKHNTGTVDVCCLCVL